jgi:hypothetical protein
MEIKLYTSERSQYQKQYGPFPANDPIPSINRVMCKVKHEGKGITSIRARARQQPSAAQFQ